VFDELSAADEALALGTSELPAGADILASRITARHSRDKDDLLVLLDALGLPTDPDATTPLLPLIPTPDPAADATDPEPSGDQPVMPNSPAQTADDAPAAGTPAVDAFEAVAVSMHHSGYLADLTRRLATEQATAEAEDRIAKLRADLRAEEERLRQLKAGGPRAAAVIEAPTPIRPVSGKRSREELAAIRTWARANGHQVAAAGVIKAKIVEAYDDAHQEPATLAKAG
jgi:hypothetical protein